MTKENKQTKASQVLKSDLWGQRGSAQMLLSWRRLSEIQLLISARRLCRVVLSFFSSGR